MGIVLPYSVLTPSMFEKKVSFLDASASPRTSSNEPPTGSLPAKSLCLMIIQIV